MLSVFCFCRCVKPIKAGYTASQLLTFAYNSDNALYHVPNLLYRQKVYTSSRSRAFPLLCRHRQQPCKFPSVCPLNSKYVRLSFLCTSIYIPFFFRFSFRQYSLRKNRLCRNCRQKIYFPSLFAFYD